MSRQDADHAEHFVKMCQLDREKHPLSPLPSERRPRRRVSRDFASGSTDYVYDEGISFLLLPQAG